MATGTSSNPTKKKRAKKGPTWLSPERYAAWRAARKLEGATRQAVMKAIRDGRVTSVERSGRFWRVAAEDADRQWKEGSAPEARGRTNRGGAPRRDQTGSMFAAPADAEAEAKAREEHVTHARASTRKTLVQAQLAELRYRSELGELVEADAVREEAFQVATAVRDRLLRIPDRLAGELASEREPGRVHARLVAEITDALEELARVEG